MTVARDFSANAAAVPIGAFVLLRTIPVNYNRTVVEVQNQSVATIQVVVDIGGGDSGTVTSILLAGAGASAQGGSWYSNTCKGRIRIYGAADAQVSAYQE